MLLEQLAKLTALRRPQGGRVRSKISAESRWQPLWEQLKVLYRRYEREVDAFHPTFAKVPGLNKYRPAHAVLGFAMVLVMVSTLVVATPWRGPEGAAARKVERSAASIRLAKTYEPLPVGDTVAAEKTKAEMFKINQVGFLPDAVKIAMVQSADGGIFKVVDVKTRKSVFAGRLGPAVQDLDSDDMVREADFTPLAQPGEYVLVVQGSGSSHSFVVGRDVYDKLYKDAIKSYDDLARLAPAAFHKAPAYLANERSKQMDVTGGWPDAGDYGKYMPTAGIALGDLLMLAEIYPDKVLRDDVGLSSTNQDLPEYLQVLKVELDWMLKMQRGDGGVYNKVTPENFGGFSGGDGDLGGTQYVYDISTPDTALFAAVMAKASRVYKPFDASFAKTALAASERAWGFLEKNGMILPSGDAGTGGYVYGDDETQRFWAATELFKTTGAGKYHDYAKKHMATSSGRSVKPLAWIDTQSLGLITYYFTDAADGNLKNKINDELVNWADDIVTTIYSPINGYKSSLSVYGWASNKTALDNAVVLIIADRIAPNQNYLDAALEQLNYVLGRNTMGKSYVTGYGSDFVKKPHNRTMVAIGKLVPGVMVGGPNKDAQDGIAPASLGPRSYVDETGAYSVNENSIEYNAPLVFVTAYFRP